MDATSPKAPANSLAVRGRGRLVKKVLFYLVLTFFALLSLYPIFFCLISSLKTNSEIFRTPYSLPMDPQFQNYAKAWVQGNIGRYFVNSLVLTIASLALTALVASMAAYVLSRYVFKGQNALLMFFVAGLMIPVQATIIPLAFGFGKLAITDNYVVMVMLYTSYAIPTTVFIMAGFIKALPDEVEEAAIMDGCNPLQVFFRIVLPLCQPALATVSILNFTAVWNNLLFPLLFIRSPELNTISIGLLMFFAERTDDYGGIMAGAAITIVPAILMYVLLQEKVEKGLTAGAVKG